MQNTVEKLRNSREEARLFLLSLDLEKREKEILKRELELDTQKEKTSAEELYNSHAVEFRSQSIASFYNTKMEKDKTLLTLSIATLGFIITFLNSTFELSWQTTLITSASAALLYTSYAIIKIFDKNGDYILASIKDENEKVKKISLTLRKLDASATNSFYAGILLTVILAAVSQYKKEDTMKKEPSGSCSSLQVSKESFAGASSLKPNEPSKTEKDSKKEEKKEDKK